MSSWFQILAFAVLLSASLHGEHVHMHEERNHVVVRKMEVSRG